MFAILRSALFFGILLAITACSSLPSEHRVPVEDRDQAGEPSAAVPPGSAAKAPVESRLPAPATAIEVLPPPGEADSRAETPIQAPATSAEQPQASPAVVALLETARKQAAAGEDEQAAANLERALRIEPKNPWLWHRLGVLRLQQGNYQAAIDLANKSNALAAGNRRLLAGNWELLARAYSALGREAEAERARRNARRLQEPLQGQAGQAFSLTASQR